MPKNIRAIFVDISGVLINNQLPEIYRQFEEKYGIGRNTFRQVLHHFSLSPNIPQDLTSYLQTLSIPAKVWTEFLDRFRHSETVNRDLSDILSYAKQNGVKIIVTSNNVTDLRPRLTELGIASLPDLIIASGEIGLTKPDPAFWNHAFRETKKLLPDIKPDQILVIDDHLDNLESAKDNGFQIYTYLGDLSKINQELRSLLVI